MPLPRWRPSWRPTFLALLTLALIALATTWWQRQLLASLRDYHAPGLTLVVQPVEAGSAARGETSPALASPPVAQQVVVIVISGLRADAARRLPTLASLAERGARGEIAPAAPVGLAATWGALLTGAGPEWSGAALLDTAGGAPHPLAAETLLGATRRAGLRAALYGQGSWASLFAGETVQGGAPTAYTIAAVADQATTQAARDALSRANVDLAVVGYGHVAQAAAAYGPASAEYDKAAQTADGQVQELLRGFDLRRSVVIVTGDRGLADVGGEDRGRVPFIMVGGGIRPGDFGRIPQTDLAPTAAALLGAGAPTLAQGTARGDMLQVADGVRAQITAADARQKLVVERALAEAYGTDRDRQVAADEIAGLPVVQTALALGNDAAGWRLAEPTVREAQRRIEALRQRTVTAEVDRRLLPFLMVLAALVVAAVWHISLARALMLAAAGVALLGPLNVLALTRPLCFVLPLAVAAAVTAGLITLWRRRDPRAMRLTVAGGVGGAALVLGTLAAPPDPTSLLTLSAAGRAVAWPAILALVWGGAAAVALTWWDETPAADEAAWLATVFSLSLAGLLVALLAFTWWQAGEAVLGFLPPVRYLAAEMLTLARLLAIALGGLLLPWLAAAASLAGTLRLDHVGQPAHESVI